MAKERLKEGVPVRGKKGGKIVSIEYMQYDNDGNLYILKDLKNPLTGALEAQQLDYYDINKMLFKKVQSHNLDLEGGRYRWISIGSTITLLGTDDGNTQIVRSAFDHSTIAAKTILAPKSNRIYAIDSAEGIYEAVTVGSEVAYISASGKLFVTQGNGTGVREVYPARELDRVI